jgi:hypothetical protein
VQSAGGQSRGGLVTVSSEATGFPSRRLLRLVGNTVETQSANVVKLYTKACRRVLTSTLLYLIGSESSCDLGSESYKLNLKNYIYIYNNYILNLVGRSIGKFSRNRLVSGGS